MAFTGPYLGSHQLSKINHFLIKMVFQKLIEIRIILYKKYKTNAMIQIHSISFY